MTIFVDLFTEDHWTAETFAEELQITARLTERGNVHAFASYKLGKRGD